MRSPFWCCRTVPTPSPTQQNPRTRCSSRPLAFLSHIPSQRRYKMNTQLVKNSLGHAQPCRISQFRRAVGLPSNGRFAANAEKTLSANIRRGNAASGVRTVTVRTAKTPSVDSTVEIAQLRELTQDDFYEYLSEAGNDLVVIDFFTDWCGPCKLMYPKLVEMSEEYAENGVRIVKFNCNKYNKDLGKSLGVRVAPTFFLYKNSAKIAEMTGAHVDRLKKLIEENM